MEPPRLSRNLARDTTNRASALRTFRRALAALQHRALARGFRQLVAFVRGQERAEFQAKQAKLQAKQAELEEQYARLALQVRLTTSSVLSCLHVKNCH